MRATRRGRWKQVIALIGLVVALTGGSLAAWLLPAPTSPAQMVIAGEPEIHIRYKVSPSDDVPEWAGPPVWVVRFLRDKTMLASIGPWNPLTFRDLTGVRPNWTVEGVRGRVGHFADGGTWPYAFSSDGSALVGCDQTPGCLLRIWDAPTGRIRATVNRNDRWVRQLAFSADGKRLAVGWQGFGIADRELIGMTIYDVGTGTERSSLSIDDIPRDGHIPLVAISADSGTLAFRRRSDGLELWDVASARLRATIAAPTAPGDIGESDWVFSPDGTVLATRLPDNTIGLWDATTGHQRLRATTPFTPGSERTPVRKNWFVSGGKSFAQFAFSPDSTTLAVACPDGAVHLWDIPLARLVTVLPPPVPSFEDCGPIVFSNDGRYLAIAGEGRLARESIDCPPYSAASSATTGTETPWSRSAD